MKTWWSCFWPPKVHLVPHPNGGWRTTDGGLTASACWFGQIHTHMAVGEYVAIATTYGKRAVYRIERFNWPRDPGDQVFMDLTYAKERR